MENQPVRRSTPYSQYPPPARPYGAQNRPAHPASPPSFLPGTPGSSPSGPRKPAGGYLWLTIVVALLLVIFFGVLFTAAASKASNPPVAGNATATPVPAHPGSPTRAPSSPAPGTHKLFDVANIDNWLVTVYATRLSVGGQYDTLQHPGDIFLEISVSVINETGRSQTFPGLLAFRLRDTTGQTYNETYVVDAGSPPSGVVVNGGKMTGTVAYEVPKTIHTFEFAIAPDISNLTKEAIWSLTV